MASLFSGAVAVVYVKKNMSPEGAELSETVVRALAKFAEVCTGTDVAICT